MGNRSGLCWTCSARATCKAFNKDPNRRYKNWELKDRKKQPKIGHCKSCKYFEYDSVAKVDGIPLIIAHEVCNKWGDGCKTKEDGYCFLFEPKAESEAQE